MKVKLTQGMVGATDKGVTWTRDPGDEVEVTPEQGAAMIERGIARPIEAAKADKK